MQGKTTGGRILPQVEKKVAGLGVIKKYSPIIKVKDDLGIEKSFNPKNASFHETLQAWNQARKQILHLLQNSTYGIFALRKSLF